MNQRAAKMAQTKMIKAETLLKRKGVRRGVGGVSRMKG